MTATTGENHAERRSRSIRLAVATSFVSKAGTILLQLLSIPIAVRVLGRGEFGLYTTVNLTLSTMALLEVGVGPALAHGLSKARAAGNESRQRELGSSAFFLLLGIAALAGLILSAVLLSVPISTLYGAEYAGRESALRPALWVGLGLFLCILILNLTERIREGHLEVATNNLWGASGNVLAACLVGVGIWWVPQVWYLVLAVHGAMVMGKICNTLTLLGKHPLMRPSSRFFRKDVARGLFADGLSFSTCCVITGVIEYNLCGWMVGRTGGPAQIALYGVFISLTVMQLGFVVMLSTPTWPAVAEALARGDLPWARAAAKKLYLFGGGFALCSMIGLVALGPWILPIWLGQEFSNLERSLLACYGLYFVAHVWRHLNHAMMIGTGQVSKLVVIQSLESVVLATLAWPILRWGGVPALLAMMGLVILTFTGSILPRKVWTRFAAQ